MAAPLLVTIALPTYNRAEGYFPLALQSALRQTYANLEIIVADNCSTDRTRELVQSIRDPRLRYFRHEPGIGQRNNYNFCVAQASGSYLLLLHDDDIIDDDFVVTCMSAADGNSEYGIIRTGVRIIDEQGNVSYERPNEVAGLPFDSFMLNWFMGKAPIYCCNTLFNAQKLREMDGFQSKHFCYPDTMAIFRLAARHPRLDIREVKASFRIHSNEAGASRRINDWCEDSLELLQLMGDLAQERRNEILKAGTRFLSRVNYNRASKAKSPWERARATMRVMRYFDYRCLPSLNIALRILNGTQLYKVLRLIKRRFVGPVQVIAAD